MIYYRPIASKINDCHTFNIASLIVNFIYFRVVGMGNTAFTMETMGFYSSRSDQHVFMAAA